MRRVYALQPHDDSAHRELRHPDLLKFAIHLRSVPKTPVALQIRDHHSP